MQVVVEQSEWNEERRIPSLPLYPSKPSHGHSVSLCPGFDWTSKRTLSRRGARGLACRRYSGDTKTKGYNLTVSDPVPL
jgi:hypothetical protein